ncbi:MAG: tyrosine-type recombinase/integrase [Prevotellaceae bacterium]|nr:tyrosine-type recombinase/integrase [Prevotellaceae bacterium]
MAQIVDSFLEYMKSERNRSEQTITAYGKALRDFESFFNSIDEGISWMSVDADIVREWMLHLMEKEGMKASSVNLKLSALRTFYHYLLLTRRISRNPLAVVVGPKKSKVLPTFVKEQDMERLLNQPMPIESFDAVRDRMAIMMLYLTGMRRAELLGLHDRDILQAERQIKVTGKRNKQRFIPYGNELAAELERYIRLRNEHFDGRQEGDRFLLDNKGRNLGDYQLHDIVRRQLGTVTGQQKRSPHVLRHSFATAMLNNGANLQSIQKLLGHESLTTTQVYTHLSFEELKNEYKNAHPRS